MADAKSVPVEDVAAGSAALNKSLARLKHLLRMTGEDDPRVHDVIAELEDMAATLAAALPPTGAPASASVEEEEVKSSKAKR